MTPPKKSGSSGDHERFMAEIQREKAQRQKGYREQALAIFPHVCARCGREFSGKRLRELTVHHRDHNHHNNPPDGSNWELLCLYCHDYEHQDRAENGPKGQTTLTRHGESDLGYRPFAGLENLVKPPEEKKD